jgi:hypothetical protein
MRRLARLSCAAVQPDACSLDPKQLCLKSWLWWQSINDSISNYSTKERSTVWASVPIKLSSKVFCFDFLGLAFESRLREYNNPGTTAVALSVFHVNEAGKSGWRSRVRHQLYFTNDSRFTSNPDNGIVTISY